MLLKVRVGELRSGGGALAEHRERRSLCQAPAPQAVGHHHQATEPAYCLRMCSLCCRRGKQPPH